MRFSFSFSFSNSSTMSSPSPSSIPPPPPPSPNDSLLDISPRKSSFSSASSRDTSCAFPSWPNRSSLLAEAEQSASSYISDEDLFPTSSPASPPSSSSCTAWSTPLSGSLADDAQPSTMNAVLGAPDLTTEEQIQMMREAAEEEDRRTQYLAHAQAHARAQQALRVAQLQQQNGMRRKKGRVVADKKRRSTSSSSSTSKTTTGATTTRRGMD